MSQPFGWMSFNGTDFEIVCDKGLVVNQNKTCGGYRLVGNVGLTVNQIKDSISAAYRLKGYSSSVFLIQSPDRPVFHLSISQSFNLILFQMVIGVPLNKANQFKKVLSINNTQQIIGLFLSTISNNLFVLIDSNTSITYCAIDDVS